MSDRTTQPAFRAAELAAILARHYPSASPHLIAAVVIDMQRATRAARQFAEDQCNFDLGDPDDAKSAYAKRRRRQDRTEAAVNDRLAYNRLYLPDYRPEDHRHLEPATIALGGDPRGACGRLVVPGQRSDGWGDGFAIY